MVEDEYAEEWAEEPPVRRPALGRMSVFVIGLVVGAVLGACAAAAGWGYLQPLLKPAAQAVASAAAAPAKPKAAPPRPAQSIRVAADRPLVIGVYGDSMADGLWAGLYRRLRDGKAYEVLRFSQNSTGLTRYEYVDVHAKTAEQLAERPVDVAIVMFGANDAQGMLVDGAVYPFESPQWRQTYAARMDALIGLFREHGTAVYWVGLPRMKRPAYDRKAGVLNEIYAERAAALGVPFIATVPVTVNREGDYEDYLTPEGARRPRLMRAKDGIHMTMAGYLRLAAPVSDLLRADVGAVMAAAAPLQARPMTLVAGPAPASAGGP